MLGAIEKSKLQVIFTYPNADYKNSEIIKILNNFIKKNRRYKLITNASPKLYSNLLRNCVGMIGNSSSGFVGGHQYSKFHLCQWVIDKKVSYFTKM